MDKKKVITQLLSSLDIDSYKISTIYSELYKDYYEDKDFDLLIKFLMLAKPLKKIKHYKFQLYFRKL